MSNIRCVINSRSALVTLALLFYSISSQAQCRCQKINRNGTQITQCQPLPVAYDNTSQIGVSIVSNGRSDFIAITVRFKNSAKKITSDLTLYMDNQSMIKLPLINSQLAYIGNSEVAQAIYQTDKSDLASLGSSNIKTMSFKMHDNMIRTYQAKKNKDILVKQLKCL